MLENVRKDIWSLTLESPLPWVDERTQEHRFLVHIFLHFKNHYCSVLMPPTTKSITYDAHARPPESLRNLFKDWRKKSLEDVESAQNVLDPFEPDQGKVHFLPGRSYLRIDSDFINGTPQPDLLEVEEAKPHAFEVVALPGTQCFPDHT